MDADEIPNWVPSAVKQLAVTFKFEEELVRRLVTDPRMKDVWQYLRRPPPAGPEISDIDSKLLLEVWGVSAMDVSVQEQACVLFFSNIVIELCFPKTAAVPSHSVLELA